MFSLALICAAAVESVTLPKLAGLGPVLPGVAYKAGTAKTASKGFYLCLFLISAVSCTALGSQSAFA